MVLELGYLHQLHGLARGLEHLRNGSLLLVPTPGATPLPVPHTKEQAMAWLRYNTEFHLKLAANNSWNFEQVNTELWVSYFVADGLTSVPIQSPQLACYAYCPIKPAQSRPLATTSKELPAAPILIDKRCCFPGSCDPYAHTCTHCGGHRACLELRTL